MTERALAHPEVQRFRELFGGEVRTVRNLKEPWNENENARKHAGHDAAGAADAGEDAG